MTTTEPRTGLVIPAASGADPYTELKDGIRAVGVWLESNGLMYATGLDSARPAFGTSGRVYKPTDVTGVVYYDTGSAWETIGGAAATDADPAVGSLRTLGSGHEQAAPGDTTAAAVAQIIASDLRAWSRPGLEVPGLKTTVTTVSAGPTTVVAAPASNRRVVKAITFATAAAGAAATVTWAGVTLKTVTFLAAGVASLDVCLPAAVAEPLQVTATGGTVQVTASWADRSDALVARLGYAASSSASGTLISSGTARTVTYFMIANNSASATATTTVAVGGTTWLPSLSMPPQSFIAFDSPFALTSSQALTFIGDATNALTYLAVGR